MTEGIWQKIVVEIMNVVLVIGEKRLIQVFVFTGDYGLGSPGRASLSGMGHWKTVDGTKLVKK